MYLQQESSPYYERHPLISYASCWICSSRCQNRLAHHCPYVTLKSGILKLSLEAVLCNSVFKSCAFRTGFAFHWHLGCGKLGFEFSCFPSKVKAGNGSVWASALLVQFLELFGTFPLFDFVYFTGLDLCSPSLNNYGKVDHAEGILRIPLIGSWLSVPPHNGPVSEIRSNDVCDGLGELAWQTAHLLSSLWFTCISLSWDKE